METHTARETDNEKPDVCIIHIMPKRVLLYISCLAVSISCITFVLHCAKNLRYI